jgi:hypothetical protein
LTVMFSLAATNKVLVLSAHCSGLALVDIRAQFAAVHESLAGTFTPSLPVFSRVR